MSTQPPRTLAFEDIRKGDRIRIENVDSGVTYSREGVAHDLVNGTWWTEGDGVLTWREDTTFTLLERTAPDEPTGLGAIVRARFGGRGPYEYIRVGGRWPWAAKNGERGTVKWNEFDPDSIEVLHPGIEVDQ